MGVLGWLLSLSIMTLGFIHVVACLFLFIAEYTPLYHYTTLCLSTHRLMDICHFAFVWFGFTFFFFNLRIVDMPLCFCFPLCP